MRRSRSSRRRARSAGTRGGGCYTAAAPIPPPTSVSEPPTATRTLHGFHAVTARLRLRPRVRARDLRRGGARRRARCATSSRGPRRRASTCTRPTGRGSTHSPARARHQGVVAIVDAAVPHVTLDDVLDALDGAGAAAGARRRHRSAQPRRLPAQRRCLRRARGDRARRTARSASTRPSPRRPAAPRRRCR